jgi:hypothetical protein
VQAADQTEVQAKTTLDFIAGSREVVRGLSEGVEEMAPGDRKWLQPRSASRDSSPAAGPAFR